MEARILTALSGRVLSAPELMVACGVAGAGDWQAGAERSETVVSLCEAGVIERRYYSAAGVKIPVLLKPNTKTPK